tara:strand:+ start:83 stop:556 length:474 start_codon:yes stop_codon:yes gene_type:complete
MASTVSASTLTVTIKEDINLNGVPQGSTKTHTITGIDEVFSRVVTCTTGQETTLAVFDTDVHSTAGALDVGDVEYIRVSNLDNAETAELGIVATSKSYTVTLGPGMSHVLGASAALAITTANETPDFGTMTNLKKIIVKPNGGANIDVEIFAASKSS